MCYFSQYLKNIDSHNLVVGCYYSFQDEVATQSIISYLLLNNIRVALPVVNGDSILFSNYDSNQELQDNIYSIKETKKKNFVDPNLLIVPLVAFNDKGDRIGRGSGFYDRYLSKCKIETIGLAYEMQKNNSWFASELDVPLHCIITEIGVYKF